MIIKDSNFVITGGNRGIGLAVAQMASKKNAHVHIVTRKSDASLKDELLKLGAKSVRLWEADLSTRQGVDRLVSDLKDVKVDILFNNAGLLTGGLLEEQPLDDIYSMFQVNLNAVVHLTKALLPSMIERKKGKIINNSSVSAFMHFPCATTYAASKAAIVAFTNCLQAELKGTGVTTLCLVTPGIKTRMFDDIENKYSKNFSVPQGYITPEQYAEKICNAIEKDHPYYWPSGATGFGLWIARYANPLFKKVIAKKFRR